MEKSYMRKYGLLLLGVFSFLFIPYYVRKSNKHR
ncbi:hypothetical protein BFAG_00159 [Bacteroides fragilis 3_1_12]|uniref:Uncharacterized protein n=1 Tax=Bacteroides fragilis 3_1_12 TaxID=457424 RepID=A0ABN0BF00_BACFG|nr:hypothetical protein BFAG_00159 [Bacteroides fragilis 3_1_12]